MKGSAGRACVVDPGIAFHPDSGGSMRMLRQLGLLSLAVGLTVAACGDESGPAAEVYRATMSGANESPPVQTTATGTATFTVNANNLDYTVTISSWPAGRTVTAAHIHAAPATVGGNASPILNFTGANAMTITGGSGTIALPQAVLDQIRAGRTYFNVHSTVNGGGELRGDLVRQ
jgi:hypothetical protein